MPITTEVIQEELQVYLSENMTNNDDGGGLQSNTQFTGEDNQVFDPVGTVTRVKGGFKKKKLYASLRRPDDAKVGDAHTIITRTPDTPSWSFLLCKAEGEGEIRVEAADRISQYNTKSTPNALKMYSSMLKNGRSIIGYQRVEQALPVVGQAFCLSQEKTGYETAEQYVRVSSVSSEVRTFEDDQGTFERAVVVLEIEAPLEYTFWGDDDVYRLDAASDPATTLYDVRNTGVTSFYGVKQAVDDMIAGAKKINLGSIYEKIIPTSTIETNIQNESAGTIAGGYVDASSAVNGVVEYQTSAPMVGGSTFFTGSPVAPNSLTVTVGSLTLTEAGGKLYNGGVVVATVDYSGSFTATADANFSGTKTIRFRPAGSVDKVSDTASLTVDITNQRKSYVTSLPSEIAPGSMTVSYRVLDEWYTLTDDGSGTLSGTSPEYGTGSIDFANKSVVLSLETVPDIDTAMLFAWGGSSEYFNRADIVVAKPEVVIKLASDGIIPNSLSIDYLDGVTPETATDDGAGNIVGTNISGTVDYTNNVVRLLHTTLPAQAAEYAVTANSYLDTSNQSIVLGVGARDGSGYYSFDLQTTDVIPGTVSFSTELYYEKDGGGSTTAITYKDDGNGNIVTSGQTCGTIDYTTGTGAFNPDVLAGAWVFTSVKSEIEGRGYWHWSRGYELVQHEHVGAAITASFIDDINTQAISLTHTLSSLTIDVTPRYGEYIVANSTVFEMGGSTYYDNRGVLSRNLDVSTGAATDAGTMNLSTGECTITSWTAGQSTDIVLKSLLTSPDLQPVAEVSFNTTHAPLYPQSFQISCTDTQGNNILVSADADGNVVDDGVEGTIDVETGIARLRFGEYVTAAGNEAESFYDINDIVNGEIWKPAAVFASTIQYNATAYSFVPLLDLDLGIDTARFPSDGKVPIFEKGRFVVVGSRWEEDLGSVFSASDVIQLAESDLTTMCLTDSNNKHVMSDLFTYDLAAGQIEFASAIDPTIYALPLIARYAREESHSVQDISLTSITLLHELKYDHLAANCYISSAVIHGDLQALATKPFTLQTWQNDWYDEDPESGLLAKLDTTNYPIVLTDDGAVTDRWLIRFTGTNTFTCISENRGVISEGDNTLSDFSPINSVTGVPFFTIPRQAFGSGWSNGVSIRFNTTGTSVPFWIIQAVQPSADEQIDDDGFALSVRADTKIISI